ncbi:tetratricopeptide repeat protein [Azospirillum sp. CT11-132]|uniref:tetratricopeptide repeat protein n=1 Tax=Azospirillum sp. CT11-132 TaxID=3396317 RepID=UPI0039A4E996
MLSNYHLEMGYATLREGSHEAALQHFRESVALTPASAGVWCLIVDLLQRMGNGAEAEAAHRSALQVDPDYRCNGLVEIALHQYRQDRHDEALGTLSLTKDANVDVSLVLTIRALIHLGRAEMEQARACLEKSAPPPPQWATPLSEAFGMAGHAAFLRSNHDTAALAFEQALSLSPNFGTERDFWTLGRICELQGRMEDAIAFYQRAADLAPERNYNQVYLYLGAAYQAVGRWSEASQAFNFAAQVEPKNAWVHFHQGILLQHRDRLSEAIAAYDQGLEISRDDFWGLQYKATALNALKRGEEASACRRHAETRMPGSPWVAYYRAAALLHEGRLDDAVTVLQAAKSMTATLGGVEAGLFQLLLGGILRNAGHRRQALDAFDKAEAALPGNPWPMVNRVVTLLDEGDTEGALDCSSRLVLGSRDLGWAWLVHGRALAASGETASAEEAFRAGFAREPGIGWADFYLGGRRWAEEARRLIAVDLGDMPDV